ncbi:MAG TPA: glycoside hydrolase family 2 TIM barrel-domain containing protein [Bryobacteraceae bacterium]|jgi:beta-galactosidase|nr:glycoside hydrolase family 2 TIM barrel-domain containing protein [Bryobacteraceae bacterium]
MPISRRNFLEAGVFTVTLGNLLASRDAVGDQASDITQEPQSGWPRKPESRVVQSFDQGWRFLGPETPSASSASALSSVSEAKDRAAWNDGDWDQVNLPHTVRLEPLNASGGRNYQGVCWYQKHFAVRPEWRGRNIHLVFQGAMQVADVWLNGKHLITHYGGYLPFTLDISKLAQFDEGRTNVLSVRLDNSDNPEVPPGKPQNKLDFVYFGGLYRSVELQVLGDLHITDPVLADKPAGGGVFVTFPTVGSELAVVQIQTDVVNTSSLLRHGKLRQELLGHDGQRIAQAEISADLDAGSSKTLTQRMDVHQPRLWHPEHPDLYILHTILLDGDLPVDDQYIRIGIRKFQFDKETGLSINGEKFFSIGANRHQDHPYVGYALPASAHYRDVKKLRDAGFTSYRSHYPQHPAFMDACDELGVLAIVSNPGWQFVGDDVFKQRVYQNAREMIRRDRNHTSVLLWEAQLNESDNSSLAANLYRIVHEEYPIEACYASGDRIRKPVEDFHGWDVEYSRNDGSKPAWIREWGDQVDNWTDQQGSVRVPREWGETPMLVQASRHLQVLDGIFARRNAPLPANASRPSGADLWAGIDAYRGYHHQPFYGGPLDLFRLPKFTYYMFQSQRPAAANAQNIGSGPMVFIANFATFHSPTTVTVFSNCEEVRLFQNGNEVTTQKPDSGYHLPHPPFTFRLSEFSASHSMLFSTGVAKRMTAIGSLKAEGLVGGAVVATHELNAPGVPTQLKLLLDDCGRDLTADGSDWIRVYAHICDARGTTYPYGNDEVTFRVSGEGSLIGDARIRANPREAEAGIATALVRSTSTAGSIVVEASAFGLKAATLQFSSRRSFS